MPNRSDRHYLWVGRIAAGGLLLLGIVMAVRAQSLTQIVVVSFKIIGMLGAGFWLGVSGVVPRRQESGPAFWHPFGLGRHGRNFRDRDTGFGPAVQSVLDAAGSVGLRGLSQPVQCSSCSPRNLG